MLYVLVLIVLWIAHRVYILNQRQSYSIMRNHQMRFTYSVPAGCIYWFTAIPEASKYRMISHDSSLPTKLIHEEKQGKSGGKSSVNQRKRSASPLPVGLCVTMVCATHSRSKTPKNDYTVPRECKQDFPVCFLTN